MHSSIGNIFSSLHSRNYRIYFIGQGISLIGTWMQNIALSWLVYRLTGSVFLLGVIGFTNQIPMFILAPFSGVLTDRYNRLRLMTLAQLFFMLQALTMTLLVLTSVIQIWQIIALSIVFGIISALDAPARQSLVIDLIDNPKDLGNAIALNSAIFNGARLIGPAIAGIIIAAAGEGVCFLLNTLSFAGVITSLWLIKIPQKENPGHSGRFKANFMEGLQYTFRSVPIRTFIILLAVLSLMGLPFIVLLPAYAKEIMQGDADTLGYLMSALGAGALTAALIMASRKSVLGLGRILSSSLISLGISMVLISLSHHFYFSLLIFFSGGLSMIFSLASVNTFLQTIAEEDKRGRVMSFYSMALMGTSPFGNLLTGSVASGIGIPPAILICGLITISLGTWFELTRRSLRKYVHPIYISKGIIPGLPVD